MRLKRVLPILEWLPKYKKSYLKNDLVGGITVGIVLIPQGIAYALIAGLPPIYGLYCALIPQIIYAILEHLNKFLLDQLLWIHLL